MLVATRLYAILPCHDTGRVAVIVAGWWLKVPAAQFGWQLSAMAVPCPVAVAVPHPDHLMFLMNSDPSPDRYISAGSRVRLVLVQVTASDVQTTYLAAGVFVLAAACGVQPARRPHAARKLASLLVLLMPGFLVDK